MMLIFVIYMWPLKVKGQGHLAILTIPTFGSITNDCSQQAITASQMKLTHKDTWPEY